MSQATVVHVPDFPKMGEPHRRPTFLHREDCPHFTRPIIWRTASEAELETLPRCTECVEKD